MFGLWFPPYVALIQLIHFLNAFLLYGLVRQRIDAKAAAITAVFFLFHPALFAAHWKPMYIFDLLCGLSLLTAYRFYHRRYLIVSVLSFWCAYKSKEVAIFFPLILLAEQWPRCGSWARLVPFFSISLSFGVQALFANSNRPESAYTLRFTGADIGHALWFYVRTAWGIPWLLASGWAWLKSNERGWVLGGTVAASILMGTLLVFPGRLFPVYLYVPLLFGSVSVGAALTRTPAPVLLALTLIYGGIVVRELRLYEGRELGQARANREYVESVCAALKDNHVGQTVSYEGGPKGLNSWGIEGAIRLCTGNLTLAVEKWDVKRLERGQPVIRWTQMPQSKGFLELSRFRGELSGDWYAWEGAHRWMGATATLRLAQPEGARHLVLEVVSAPADEMELRVNGNSIGRRRFEQHGEQRLLFELPVSRNGGELELQIDARPTRRLGNDPRELGLAIRSVKVIP